MTPRGSTRTSPVAGGLLAPLLALALVSPPVSAERPALVLQITVDQLRGDMIWRFRDRFGPGGFGYLMDHGVAYSNAHYQHSTTFTAVGHATLATGGNAAQHGLAGNDWHDVTTGQRVYCVEDDRHPLIGKAPAPHKGTSPRNLTASTAGDELVLATGGRSRVFSVSIKDRGAILPGGHLGKAFWYSSSSGQFVSSTYYYDEYPAWVTAWNAADHAGAYRDQSWELLQDRARYVYGDQDDRPFEKSYKHLGRTFPHALGSDDPKAYYAALRFTPMGDEVTLAFVEELVDQERVGQAGATDVLAVSFSATDYIGHAMGPHSLEAEDNLLRLDRTLARLLELVDDRVGLERTLVVLSSDHGTDEIPEFKQSLGIAAGRHRPEEFIARANEALKARFDTEETLVVAFWNPSLYLDPEAVRRVGVDMATVEKALAEEMMGMSGFSLALTRTDLLAGNVPATAVGSRVQAAFHPKRSGNVLIVQDPFWYLYPNPDQFSAMHGSPYAYDTYVPILFAGPGIKPRTVARPVAPRDIAPTITAYLGIKPPSGAIGTPLVEVLD